VYRIELRAYSFTTNCTWPLFSEQLVYSEQLCNLNTDTQETSYLQVQMPALNQAVNYHHVHCAINIFCRLIIQSTWKQWAWTSPTGHSQ